eukprot:1159852-Pelagomonas_calceolata.AAC.9
MNQADVLRLAKVVSVWHVSASAKLPPSRRQMYPPAKVIFQHSGCEQVNKSAVCYSACACLNRNENIYRDRKCVQKENQTKLGRKKEKNYYVGRGNSPTPIQE